MRIEFYENLPRWARKTIDQILHFVFGFVIAAAINIPASIMVAVAREVIQNWGDKDNSYSDMAIDVVVWTVGAVIASVVF